MTRDEELGCLHPADVSDGGVVWRLETGRQSVPRIPRRARRQNRKRVWHFQRCITICGIGQHRTADAGEITSTESGFAP